MQQHLQRLDGVAKAEVSLRDGQVTIMPKDDGTIDPYQILKATYDSGVTVTEMEITATGNLEQSGEGLSLRLNAKLALDIAPGTEAAKLKVNGDKEARVTVKGIFYRKPPGKNKQKAPTSGLKLEITERKDVQ